MKKLALLFICFLSINMSYSQYDGEYIVEGDETWENSRQYKDILILDGGTLTITGRVAMPEDAKIIVERGAKLMIDGGYLTNACSGMWEGVEVWGNSNEPQLVTEQGWVKIQNEGTIENSKMGIYTNRPDPEEEGAFIQGYTGGIIQASDAHFINNETSVNFYSYEYHSVSWFVNCEFIINDYYIGNINPENFMKITSMDGIRITNSDFINSTSGANNQKGIYSINSNIILEGKCTGGNPCTSWDYGLFENLEYGIYATVSGSETFTDIQHTDFIGNFKGLYLSGMEGAWVTSNYFKVNSASENLGYGMYLDNCNAYKVEDNLFENTGGGQLGTGLVVHNSGPQYNIIYNNFFNNLEYGILAQERNRDKTGETGLVIKCNDYTRNLQDIAVTSEEEGEEIGIRESQGTDGNDTKNPAGNTFSYMGLDESDYYNETNDITYWYHYNQNGYNIKPLYHSIPEVNPQYNPEMTALYIKEESCPSDLEPGGGGGTGGDDGPRGRMATAGQKTDSTQMLLDLLIDGGNTEALATDVQTSYPPEAWDLYVSLLGKSPYLSDTVMTSAINKENVLPPEMVTDVLIANPQSAKSTEVLTEVENRLIPLTDEQKDAIMQNWYISGAKESLESKLAGYKADYANALYDLLTQFRYDSLCPNPQDSIIAVLELENTLWTKYMLVSEYLSQSNLTQAENTLNSIPTFFELSTKEQEEYQDFEDYFDVMVELKQTGKTIYEMDSLQLQALYVIADKEENNANSWSRNVLISADTLSYIEPVLLPTYLKSSSVIPIPAQKPANENKLFVYPNPAKGYFIIRYELDNFYAEAMIQITDMAGRTIKFYTTEMVRDYLVVSTEGIKSGNYVIKLILNGRESGVQKITIK
ncbi:MAG: T9SS type A sorting domain-containing protein [Bacteroidales bacterium]|nr:T9SS type A sorting domain-containing protein [Bacteroidales bacterium]